MTIRTIEQPVAATGGGAFGLDNHGLNPTGKVHWNLSPARLYEESLRLGDGQIVHMGAIATVTAPLLRSTSMSSGKTSSTTWRAETISTSGTLAQAPTSGTAWTSASSLRARGTRCSRTTCFSAWAQTS